MYHGVCVESTSGQVNERWMPGWFKSLAFRLSVVNIEQISFIFLLLLQFFNLPVFVSGEGTEEINTFTEALTRHTREERKKKVRRRRKKRTASGYN